MSQFLKLHESVEAASCVVCVEDIVCVIDRPAFGCQTIRLRDGTSLCVTDGYSDILEKMGLDPNEEDYECLSLAETVKNTCECFRKVAETASKINSAFQ